MPLPAPAPSAAESDPMPGARSSRGAPVLLGLLHGLVIPKRAAPVEAVPRCVPGGADLGMIGATGTPILGGVDFAGNRNNLFIVAVSVGFGMIPLVAPAFFKQMPHALHPLLESGILLPAISAVGLTLFFNGLGAAEARDAAIRRARVAEAH